MICDLFAGITSSSPDGGEVRLQAKTLSHNPLHDLISVCSEWFILLGYCATALLAAFSPINGPPFPVNASLLVVGDRYHYHGSVEVSARTTDACTNHSCTGLQQSDHEPMLVDSNRLNACSSA